MIENAVELLNAVRVQQQAEYYAKLMDIYELEGARFADGLDKLKFLAPSLMIYGTHEHADVMLVKDMIPVLVALNNGDLRPLIKDEAGYRKTNLILQARFIQTFIDFDGALSRWDEYPNATICVGTESFSLQTREDFEDFIWALEKFVLEQ